MTEEGIIIEEGTVIEAGHLQQMKQHRSVVLGVSLVCGAVGLIPVPLIPDMIIAGLRHWLLLYLARRREVAVSSHGARIVMERLRVSPDRLASITATLAGLRSMRKLARAVLLFLRFEDVVQTFLLGTYFDYYLLRYHEGDELTPKQAARVHEAADRALATAHMDVLMALFRKVVGDMIAAGLYIPKVMWDLAAAVLRGEQESVQIESVEDSRGLLARAAGLLERELSATGRVTMEAICEGFDHTWGRVAEEYEAQQKTDTEDKPERIQ